MNQKHERNIYHVSVNVYFIIKNVTRIKSGMTISVAVSVKILKNIVCVKNYIWNRAICSCENDKYVGSVIDDQRLCVIKS